MNFKSIGIARAVLGLRTGDQAAVLTGLALISLQYLRGKPTRELVYRKRLPVGSTIVVRHARRGQPRIEIRKP